MLSIGAPAIVFVVTSILRLPVVLTRVDDGDRSARLIEGNEVASIWAPEGPGWNWVQPSGGYPSWRRIALYGVTPVGLEDRAGYGRGPEGITVSATGGDTAETQLCRYLSADATTLADEPQGIWRMPARTRSSVCWSGTARTKAVRGCASCASRFRVTCVPAKNPRSGPPRSQ